MRAAPWSVTSSSVHLHRAVGMGVVLILWQLASAFGLNSYYISSPLAIAGRILQWIESGYIWPHLLATLTSMTVGYALAALAAVSLALLLGSSDLLGRIFAPLLFAAYSTPKAVLVPLLIVWVGIGRPPVIVLAVVSSFFVIFFNAYEGIRGVPQAYINTAAILGANRWTTAIKFRLPAAAPFLLSGLHQGLIYAFHGVVLGEMTASDTGIGYIIIYSATAMDSTAVLAALAVIGAISYALVCLIKGGFDQGGYALSAVSWHE